MHSPITFRHDFFGYSVSLSKVLFHQNLNSALKKQTCCFYQFFIFLTFLYSCTLDEFLVKIFNLYVSKLFLFKMIDLINCRLHTLKQWMILRYKLLDCFLYFYNTSKNCICKYLFVLNSLAKSSCCVLTVYVHVH